MATYRQVKQSFWTDPLVSDNFSAEDKYFFLYLLTNLHTNLCGCYEVSKTQIAKEMGYSDETINSVIERFENKYNLIRYDKKTYELLIINWSKHNWTDSPKFRKLVEKEIDAVKNSDFKEYLTGIFNCKNAGKYPIPTSDTVSEVSDTSLFVTNIDNSSLSNEEVSNDSNLKQVTDQKKVIRRRVYEDTPEFIQFWDAYPNKKNKMEARTAFSKVDVPLQVLLDSIATQKHSKQWMKDDGEYIPLASTWLNKRRWEDVMEVEVEKGDGMDRYRNLQRLAEEFEDE